MEAIRDVHRQFVGGPIDCGDNLGLRLDKLNSDIDDPSLSEHQMKDWMLKVISGYRLSQSLKESYRYAFNQWKSQMEKRPHCVSFEIRSLTKSLLGSGNASVHEFGVNLNKPWGVPFISGTTLKGLVTSYLFRNGGEDWYKSNLGSTKGDYQVQLFGGTREEDGQSYIGSVNFNDAWLYPANEPWFVEDIINVHHPTYYAGTRLPDGTENPIPIKIAALSKGLSFFVSIEGDQKEVMFVKSVLEKALLEDGIGGKTAVGYGRFEIVPSQEEQNKEIKEILASANNDELLKLSHDMGNVEALMEDFIREAETRPLSNDLIPIYQRFTPLKVILLKIESGEITSEGDLRKYYKQIKDNIKKYQRQHPDVALHRTEDGQKIFKFALKELALSPEDIQNNALLKQLAYGWEDVGFTEQTVVDMIMELGKGHVWPPLESLEAYIHSAGFSDKVKKEALIALKMVLEG